MRNPNNNFMAQSLEQDLPPKPQLPKSSKPLEIMHEQA